MNPKKKALPPCPVRNQKSVRLPPKNVHLKKVNMRKALEQHANSSDASLDLNTVNAASTNVLVKANSFSVPQEMAIVSLVDSSPSTAEDSSPIVYQLLKQEANCPQIGLGKQQHEANTSNESTVDAKRLQQKEYMRQLQEQIQEKARLQKEKVESLKVTGAHSSHLRNEDNIANNLSPSITGSRRGFVSNRPDLHIQEMGSVFARDEKQLLREKREKERNEMRRRLDEQVAEKRQREEEEKKRDWEFTMTTTCIKKLASTKDVVRTNVETSEEPTSLINPILDFAKEMEAESPQKHNESDTKDSAAERVNSKQSLRNVSIHSEESCKPETTQVIQNNEEFASLRSRIEVLSEENKKLTKLIKDKDNLLTKCVPKKKLIPMTHKVIKSADCNKSREQRRKEQQLAQTERANIIEQRIEAARARSKQAKVKKPPPEKCKIPTGNNPKPVLPKINRVQSSGSRQTDSEFNLDKRGESYWVYPKANGKYEIPESKFPTKAFLEVAENMPDFESMVEESSQVRSSLPKPPLPSKESLSMTMTRSHHMSNIASIMTDNNAICSPKAENGIKKSPPFPRDVFKFIPNKPAA